MFTYLYHNKLTRQERKNIFRRERNRIDVSKNVNDSVIYESLPVNILHQTIIELLRNNLLPIES